VSDYNRYIGKRLLVGITYQSPSGEFVGQAQFHGVIVQADECRIVIERADGEGLLSLPPHVQEAEPARYRLRSTGEVVCPDLIATWIFRVATPEQDA
jgi:hypothetical protein